MELEDLDSQKCQDSAAPFKGREEHHPFIELKETDWYSIRNQFRIHGNSIVNTLPHCGLWLIRHGLRSKRKDRITGSTVERIFRLFRLDKHGPALLMPNMFNCSHWHEWREIVRSDTSAWENSFGHRIDRHSILSI